MVASRSFINNGKTSEVVKPLYRGSLHTNVVNKQAAAQNAMFRSEGKMNVANKAYQDMLDLRPAVIGANFWTGISPTLKRVVFDGDISLRE